MEPETISRRGMLASLSATISASVAGCVAAPRDSTVKDAPEPAASSSDQLSKEAVYDRTINSVASVRVQTEEGPSSGSAWMYDDTRMVTNNHVVENAEDDKAVWVWFNEQGWQRAEVQGTDIFSDLAILKPADPPDSASPLPLAEGIPEVGSTVIALGNPYGLSGSFTTGVVSGVNRALSTPDGFKIADGIQTDAPVNPGNSGGPLVDMYANVVGVINSGGGDNIGFAISARMVREVIPELIQDGKADHSYLGVMVSDVNPGLIEANDLEVSRGVYVHDVVDGGPSDGVLQGSDNPDEISFGSEPPSGGDIILQIDGHPTPTGDALSRVLELRTQPGDTVDITIQRDGERKTAQVTLGRREPEDFSQQSTPTPRDS